MTYKLTDEDLKALQSYAAEHGRKWKDALELDWYNARANGPRGATLHGLRNNLGNAWLQSFKLPKAPKPGMIKRKHERNFTLSHEGKRWTLDLAEWFDASTGQGELRVYRIDGDIVTPLLNEALALEAQSRALGLLILK